MPDTELGTSGCRLVRRTSSVRIVRVSASVVEAKAPNSSTDASRDVWSSVSTALPSPSYVETGFIWNIGMPFVLESDDGEVRCGAHLLRTKDASGAFVAQNLCANG